MADYRDLSNLAFWPNPFAFQYGILVFDIIAALDFIQKTIFLWKIIELMAKKPLT